MIGRIRHMIAWLTALVVMIFTLGLVRVNQSGKPATSGGFDQTRIERPLE